MKKAIGIILLILVLASIFIACVIAMGFLLALATWAIAIGLTALLILALNLIMDN
jgi:hypothetical protein